MNFLFHIIARHLFLHEGGPHINIQIDSFSSFWKKFFIFFLQLRIFAKKFGFNEFFFFFSSSCQDFVNLNSNLSGDFYFLGNTFEFDQFDESEKFFLIFLMYSCHHKRFDFNEKALGHGNTLLWLPSSHSLGYAQFWKVNMELFQWKPLTLPSIQVRNMIMKPNSINQ